MSFDDLIARFAGRDGFEPPAEGRRGFGSTAGKVHGAIFAMAVDDRIVLKLPAETVAELIERGAGEPFATKAGARPMREWVSLPAGPDTEELAEQAYAFVRAAKLPRRQPDPRSR